MNYISFHFITFQATGIFFLTCREEVVGNSFSDAQSDWAKTSSEARRARGKKEGRGGEEKVERGGVEGERAKMKQIIKEMMLAKAEEDKQKQEAAKKRKEEEKEEKEKEEALSGSQEKVVSKKEAREVKALAKKLNKVAAKAKKRAEKRKQAAAKRAASRAETPQTSPQTTPPKPSPQLWYDPPTVARITTLYLTPAEMGER